MKKYIGFISVGMVNCMLITGLLVHAFTLDSVKDNTVNDSKKECVYIEKTTVKEEKEIDSEERQQEDKNNNSIVKTNITKSTYNNNSKNNSNDNKNYSNTNTNNSNTNNTNNSNNNNNYTVEYTNTSYCGFCGKQLNNNDGICEDCRDIRSKLGE